MKTLKLLALVLMCVRGSSVLAVRVSESNLDAGLHVHSIAANPDGVLFLSWGDQNITWSEIGYGKLLWANAGGFEALAAAPDCLWAADPAGNRIWRFANISGSPVAHNIPTANAGLSGITVGPDGNVWFTEFSANKIGRLTRSGVFTEFPLPTASAGPMAITTASNGRLYFVEYHAGRLGSITTDGSIGEYVIPTASSHPAGVATWDDVVAFTESTANKIGFFDLKNATFTEKVVPTPSSLPSGIVRGRDGFGYHGFYFTERSGNKIGWVQRGGDFKEWAVPSADADPTSLAVDDRGWVWFTEGSSSHLGRLEPSVAGDVNGDGDVNVSDVFYLIEFLFAGGYWPL